MRLILEHETNHDAEDAVMAHLASCNPRVLKRVTFDSEPDAFCIYAESGDDIQSVADAIESLATRR